MCYTNELSCKAGNNIYSAIKLAQVMVAMFIYKTPQFISCHVAKKPMFEMIGRITPVTFN